MVSPLPAPPRPPTKQQHVRGSMESQTKVLALSQVGPALPPASCEALCKRFALSQGDLPTCGMEMAIVVVKEGCHEKSRTKALAYSERSVKAAYCESGGGY